MWAVRQTIYTVIAIVATAAHARGQEIVWQPSLDAARQLASQSNRLVLLHFWGPNCRPCMQLEKEVFSRPDVAKALDADFVMAKLNVEESPATARAYGVSSIPADVIVSPSGQLVAQLQSPPTAAQYTAQLSRVANGYRELTGQAPAKVARAENAANAPGSDRPTISISPSFDGPNPPAPAVPSQSVYSNERYAEYYQRQATMAANRGPRPGAAPSFAPPGGPPAAPVQLTQGAMPGPPQQAAGGFRPPAPSVPNNAPPMALDGFCPVTLLERRAWVPGNPAHGVVHRGHTYLFAGPEEAQRFFASPDRYCPILSGNDSVLALDNQMMVPGRREFGVFVDNRVYLFANEESLQRFQQNPNRYAAEALQAMR
jgi:YHS domain-containing protein/thiol-disulfide isomerase/thioredoxin